MLFPDPTEIQKLKTIVSNSYVWIFGREAGRRGQDSVQAAKQCREEYPECNKNLQFAELFVLGYLRGYEERKAALEPWITKTKEEVISHIKEELEGRADFEYHKTRDFLVFLDGFETLEIIEMYPEFFWLEVNQQMDGYE